MFTQKNNYIIDYDISYNQQNETELDNIEDFVIESFKKVDNNKIVIDIENNKNNKNNKNDIDIECFEDIGHIKIMSSKHKFENKKVDDNKNCSNKRKRNEKFTKKFKFLNNGFDIIEINNDIIIIQFNINNQIDSFDIDKYKRYIEINLSSFKNKYIDYVNNNKIKIKNSLLNHSLFKHNKKIKNHAENHFNNILNKSNNIIKNNNNKDVIIDINSSEFINGYNNYQKNYYNYYQYLYLDNKKINNLLIIFKKKKKFKNYLDCDLISYIKSFKTINFI